MRRWAGALLILAGYQAVGENTGMTWFSQSPAEGPQGLDPKVRAALEKAGPVVEFRTQPLPELRRFFEAQAAALPKLRESLPRVEDRVLPGGIPVRLYVPEGKGPFPALLYFHGGGWVLGDFESHDDVTRSLAHRAGVLVVSVHYRRAPEARFPGPLDDCAAALGWTLEEGPGLGIDPSRIAVGGDSAGGNLAAALALRSRGRIRFQLLIYPVTDASWDSASYREFASGYGLTRANMAWFWESYLAKASDAENPLASPLRSPSLAGLAPAFILTAECDVLRDEGEAYARRLHEAGVPVRCLRVRNMNHGFIRMGALYPQADRALSALANALREGLK
jgi:acetyl esterase